jgi:hypothetical protein
MQGINFMLSLVINVKFEVIVGHGIYVHFRPVTPDQITPTMYRSLAGKTRVSERLCECSEVGFSDKLVRACSDVVATRRLKALFELKVGFCKSHGDLKPPPLCHRSPASSYHSRAICSLQTQDPTPDAQDFIFAPPYQNMNNFVVLLRIGLPQLLNYR